jgi:hypothetical protein
MQWDGETRGGRFPRADDGTDPACGLRMRFTLGSFELRGDCELYDIDDVDDVSMLSASVDYTV